MWSAGAARFVFAGDRVRPAGVLGPDLGWVVSAFKTDLVRLPSGHIRAVRTGASRFGAELVVSFSSRFAWLGFAWLGFAWLDSAWLKGAVRC